MLLDRLIDRWVRGYHLKVRRRVFRALSDNVTIIGQPIINQPVLFKGRGTIKFGNRVDLGVLVSPNLYSGYLYIEVRGPESTITIGDNVAVGNNAIIICDKTSIEIGKNCQIGGDLFLVDSDFHNIHPDRRNIPDYLCKPVCIEDNVFLGSKVTILKGVTIGKNTVIGNGSTVTRDIPENVVAVGSPAIVVKSVFD